MLLWADVIWLNHAVKLLQTETAWDGIRAFFFLNKNLGIEWLIVISGLIQVLLHLF